ncbi:MAG: RsmE family RNA methyltransferase [Pseudanabaenaceae cyanobacterium bins.68]|nr:RsmE family RNA methyltransferase [Pseudanabaenaceae cyanobacterium bins.68]
MTRGWQRLILNASQAIAAHSCQPIDLTATQSHYLYKVLRLQAGAKLVALDGKGSSWLIQVKDDKAEILERFAPGVRSNYQVTLAIAMPKGNGMENIIKQATEVGVSQIVPLYSDRTVVKAGTELGDQKLSRWQRIAQEAAELAWALYLPELLPPIAFSAWLTTVSRFDQSYICLTQPHTPHLYAQLCQALPSPQIPIKIAILIGAEGGWTEAEAGLALDYGCQPVSLGQQILSTVTAPIVALAMVNGYLDSLA